MNENDIDTPMARKNCRFEIFMDFLAINSLYRALIMGRNKNKNVRLHGFNNLTKSLSFNIYDICYAQNEAQKKEYLEYIDEEYNSDRLTKILENVAEIIDAQILNIARQDYDPQGASVTVLISEEPVTDDLPENDKKAVSFDNSREAPGPVPETVLAHLDKSHLAVHTYPESHPDMDIGTFRVDIDVSTCGKISPLKVLNYLVHSFDSDIVIIDYKVRGFTRDVRAKKRFIDHKITSIQKYMDRDIREKYQMIDMNMYQEYLFHTKMLLKEMDLDNYLFGIDKKDLKSRQRKDIMKKLRKEMLEIYYGRNMNSSDYIV